MKKYLLFLLPLIGFGCVASSPTIEVETITRIDGGESVKIFYPNETENAVESSTRVFANCAELGFYKSHPWFSRLKDEFKKGEFSSGDIGTKGDACLSTDQTKVVFIPDDAAYKQNCGTVYLFDVEGQPMKMAKGAEYCATKFGRRVDNYIEFIGGVDKAKKCANHQGKYYFEENLIETQPGNCN